MINFNIEVSKVFEKLTKNIFKTVIKYSKVKAHFLAVDINFVSIDKIRELNLKFRKKDKETDVLSFPMFEFVPFQKIKKNTYRNSIDPVTKKLFIGDIAICEEVAQRNALEYGHSKEREVFYLIVHGFFHLLGFDHEKEEDQRLMRAAEEAVLSKFKIKR